MPPQEADEVWGCRELGPKPPKMSLAIRVSFVRLRCRRLKVQAPPQLQPAVALAVSRPLQPSRSQVASQCFQQLPQAASALHPRGALVLDGRGPFPECST